MNLPLEIETWRAKNQDRKCLVCNLHYIHRGDFCLQCEERFRLEEETREKKFEEKWLPIVKTVLSLEDTGWIAKEYDVALGYQKDIKLWKRANNGDDIETYVILEKGPYQLYTDYGPKPYGYSIRYKLESPGYEAFLYYKDIRYSIWKKRQKIIKNIKKTRCWPYGGTKYSSYE